MSPTNHRVTYSQLNLTGKFNAKGLYYKTLQVCNLKKINRFCSKLGSFLLSVTNTLAKESDYYKSVIFCTGPTGHHEILTPNL